MIFTHSSKVTLQKNKVATFSDDVGDNYFYLKQLSSLPYVPDHTSRGFYVPRAMDGRFWGMRVRQSSSSSDLGWKVGLHIITLTSPTSADVQTFETPDISFGDTEMHDLRYDLSNLPVPEMSLINVSFERIGTKGSSRYYLYVDSTIELREL